LIEIPGEVLILHLMIDREAPVDRIDVGARQIGIISSRGTRRLGAELAHLELPVGDLPVPRIALDRKLEIGVPRPLAKAGCAFSAFTCS
jgi:hypothetical protein